MSAQIILEGGAILHGVVFAEEVDIFAPPYVPMEGVRVLGCTFNRRVRFTANVRFDQCWFKQGYDTVPWDFPDGVSASRPLGESPQ